MTIDFTSLQFRLGQYSSNVTFIVHMYTLISQKVLFGSHTNICMVFLESLVTTFSNITSYLDNSQEFLFASNSFYEWLSTLHIPTRVETRPQGIGDCFSSEPFEEEYKSNKLELLECQARILICHYDKITFPKK